MIVPFLGELMKLFVADVDIVVKHGKFFVSSSINASALSKPFIVQLSAESSFLLGLVDVRKIWFNHDVHNSVAHGLSDVLEELIILSNPCLHLVSAVHISLALTTNIVGE